MASLSVVADHHHQAPLAPPPPPQSSPGAPSPVPAEPADLSVPQGAAGPQVPDGFKPRAPDPVAAITGQPSFVSSFASSSQSSHQYGRAPSSRADLAANRFDPIGQNGMPFNPHSPPDGSFNLYITGIPHHWEQQHLFSLFTPFGSVKRVDKLANGNEKGCVGFVHYLHLESAQQAIEQLDNAPIPGGRDSLHVKFSKNTSTWLEQRDLYLMEHPEAAYGAQTHTQVVYVDQSGAPVAAPVAQTAVPGQQAAYQQNGWAWDGTQWVAAAPAQQQVASSHPGWTWNGVQWIPDPATIAHQTESAQTVGQTAEAAQSTGGNPSLADQYPGWRWDSAAQKWVRDETFVSPGGGDSGVVEKPPDIDDLFARQEQDDGAKSHFDFSDDDDDEDDPDNQGSETTTQEPTRRETEKPPSEEKVAVSAAESES